MLVEVVGQRFTGLAQGVFQFVGQHQLFFLDLGEHEQHIFQGHVQEVGGVGAVFQAFFKVEQIQMIADFAVELVQFLEIDFRQAVRYAQTAGSGCTDF